MFLLTSTATAQQQQLTEAQNAQLGEFDHLSYLLRTLSSCPNLIEDWEYTVLAARSENIAYDLTGGRSALAAQRRAGFSRAIGSNCSLPEVQALAIDAREYARRTWMIVSRAYRELNTCDGAPSTEDRLFLADFEIGLILRNNLDEALKELGEEDLTSAVRFGVQRAGQLNAACLQADNKFDRLPGWQPFYHMATAPLTERDSFTTADGRARGFDLNQGFTLGLGETEIGTLRRDTRVLGIRGSTSSSRFAQTNNTICGGEAPEGENGYGGVIDCDVTAWGDGRLQASIRGSGSAFSVTAATLEIRDLRTGNLIRALPGRVINANAGGQTQDAVVQFDTAIQFLAQSAGTLDQVHMTFDGQLTDGRQIDFDLVDVNFRQTRSVAALDFLRAIAFAYSPDDSDLSLAVRRSYSGE